MAAGPHLKTSLGNQHGDTGARMVAKHQFQDATITNLKTAIENTRSVEVTRLLTNLEFLAPEMQAQLLIVYGDLEKGHEERRTQEDATQIVNKKKYNDTRNSIDTFAVAIVSYVAGHGANSVGRDTKFLRLVGQYDDLSATRKTRLDESLKMLALIFHLYPQYKCRLKLVLDCPLAGRIHDYKGKWKSGIYDLQGRIEPREWTKSCFGTGIWKRDFQFMQIMVKDFHKSFFVKPSCRKASAGFTDRQFADMQQQRTFRNMHSGLPHIDGLSANVTFPVGTAWSEAWQAAKTTGAICADVLVKDGVVAEWGNPATQVNKLDIDIRTVDCNWYCRDNPMPDPATQPWINQTDQENVIALINLHYMGPERVELIKDIMRADDNPNQNQHIPWHNRVLQIKHELAHLGFKGQYYTAHLLYLWYKCIRALDRLQVCVNDTYPAVSGGRMEAENVSIKACITALTAYRCAYGMDERITKNTKSITKMYDKEYSDKGSHFERRKFHLMMKILALQTKLIDNWSGDIQLGLIVDCDLYVFTTGAYGKEKSEVGVLESRAGGEMAADRNNPLIQMDQVLFCYLDSMCDHFRIPFFGKVSTRSGGIWDTSAALREKILHDDWSQVWRLGSPYARAGPVAEHVVGTAPAVVGRRNNRRGVARDDVGMIRVEQPR